MEKRVKIHSDGLPECAGRMWLPWVVTGRLCGACFRADQGLGVSSRRHLDFPRTFPGGREVPRPGAEERGVGALEARGSGPAPQLVFVFPEAGLLVMRGPSSAGQSQVLPVKEILGLAL